MNLPLQVGFFLHYSLTKPADFTECVGDELPVGWEQAYDYHRGGIYYVDHRNRKGPSINDVGNFVQCLTPTPLQLPTSFMDGPLMN